MTRFRIHHTLRYELSAAVARATVRARLEPRSLPGQDVEQFRLDVAPAPAARSSAEDRNGNRVQSIEVNGPLRSLEIVAESVVSLDVDARRESLRAFRAAAPPWQKAIRASVNAPPPRRRPPPESLSGPVLIESHGPASWEAEIVAAGGRRREDADAFVEQAAARAAAGVTDMPALLDAVVTGASRALVYDVRAARPGRSLADALARGRGVCQDYANLAIAVFGALGVTARYVAGYVAGAGRAGAASPKAASLHAWIAVLVPGHGWVHADPTAGSIGCERHVVCALGRGYWETAPIAGDLDGDAEIAREARVEMEEIATAAKA